MNGKRIIKIGIPAVAGICVLALTAVALIPGRDKTTLSKVKQTHEAYASADDSDWEEVEAGSIVLENERVSLTMDAETAHFTVTDKTTGYSYASHVANPETYSDEYSARMQSELTAVYYDSQSKMNYLGSSESVEKGNLTVKRQGDTIRVTYVFGTDASAIFAPEAFTKERFEKDILDNLKSDSDRRRIKLLYRLYTKDGDMDQEDFNEALKKYPYLENGELYILHGSSSDTLKQVTRYMKDAGYTAEQYEADRKVFDSGTKTGGLPMGFRVPVEYSLTADGFTARVLTDKITENNKTDVLQSVSLLEFFGACGSGKSGYMLVPDGSGSILEINRKADGNYIQRLYNEDDAIRKNEDEKVQLSRNAPLPVFGYNQGDNAFFAVIEGASAMATVTARTMGSANPQNNLFASFDLRGKDTTSIGTDRSIEPFNLYAGHITHEFPQVRYMLLSGESSSYSGMANRYRAYLLDEGSLGERLTPGDMPLYLDFTGQMTGKASVLGIPYTKRTPLSTLEDIDKIVTRLNDSAVNNLQIRLKSYGRDGIDHSVYAKLDLARGVGSEQQLCDLAERLRGTGGRLYLDADFTYVHTAGLFGDYSQRNDGARRLDKSVISLSPFNLVTLQYEDKANRLAVAPAAYRYFAGSFLDSAQKKLGDKRALLGFSWGTGGEYITSDFNKELDFDLSMTKDAISETMAYMAGQTDALLTDYGNVYTLPYVKGILGMPLSSSRLESETRTVPFYQMVVHGYRDYAGDRGNMAPDQETNLLDTAASGASLYYDWITADDALMKETAYSLSYYSMQADKFLQQAAEQYARYNAVFAGLRHQTITRHEWVRDDMAVNYGFSPVVLNGKTVGARDFAVVSGAEGDETVA